MSLLPTPTKRVNYLNNRDILKEIHSSKNTYCSFTLPEHNRYDFIIDLPGEPIEKSLEYACKPETIQLAKEGKAARISFDTGIKTTADAIDTEGLIFRIMTWDHIPVAPKQPRKTVKKRTAKDIIEFEDDEPFSDLEDGVTKAEIDDMVHVKVNFPPFKHYLLSNGSLVHVGNSHWDGSLVDGTFSKEHGQISKTLAKMFIMLCEKYAMKFNWRGYSYSDEMRNSSILQLTYVGLRFNESKSANPFAFYTSIITNSFCRVLNTEKRNQNIRDDIMQMNSMNPSYTRQSMSSGKVYEE